MRESKEEKKARVLKIALKLKEKYPVAKSALNFKTPLDLLIATILSAQCTDVRVNKVTEKLFQKYKTAEDYAYANEEEFMNEIKSINFYQNKGKLIISAAKKIVENFNGEIPSSLEKLTILPGVGRKTANLVLTNCFNIPAVIVDTHVRRISNLLKLTEKDNPDEIEKDLMEILPEKEWSDFSHRIMYLGREVCTARKPLCSACMIKELCPSAKEN